jgi:hypothetical protein
VEGQWGDAGSLGLGLDEDEDEDGDGARLAPKAGTTAAASTVSSGARPATASDAGSGPSMPAKPAPAVMPTLERSLSLDDDVNAMLAESPRPLA